MSTSARAARPGGRSARVQAAVYSAATDLVTELGADRVTIPMIAERAGVTPSTLYRRWRTLPALLAEMAGQWADRAPAPTGDLRADLADQAAWTLTDLTRPGGIAFFRAEVAPDVDERKAGMRECLRRVSHRFETVLAAARDADHVRPLTLAQVLDRIVAPIYFRVVFSIPGTDEAYARSLATDLMDSIEAQPGAPTE